MTDKPQQNYCHIVVVNVVHLFLFIYESRENIVSDQNGTLHYGS